MRIAFDYQTFTLQRYGGISRYFARLASELLAAGEDVGVFAPFYQNGYLGGLPGTAVHGRRVSSFPRKTTRAFLELNRIASASGLRRWRPDIVHETYYAPHSSRVRGVPLILTVYDMTHEVCAADFASDDPTSAAKRMAVARADHIICISRSTQRDLVKIFGVEEHRTSAVLLGVDPPALADPLPATEHDPFLLFVGVRAGYKNFDGFLRAAAASSLVREGLRIVAFGGGAFTEEERTMIARLGLVGQVRHVAGDDRLLGRYYASAAALVYPSRYEGFGLPPLEAMAHDCPVICSNTSSLPEVVEDAAELFDPADEGMITKAIDTVVASPELQRTLIERGRDRVRILTWERCARETRAVYQSVAGGAG